MTFLRRWLLWVTLPLTGLSLIGGYLPGSLLFGALLFVLPAWTLLAFWYVSRNQFVEMRDDGVRIKTTDTDITLAWGEISAVSFSVWCLYVNTPRRRGSLSIPFVEKAQAKALYDRHFDVVGLRARE